MIMENVVRYKTCGMCIHFVERPPLKVLGKCLLRDYRVGKDDFKCRCFKQKKDKL